MTWWCVSIDSLPGDLGFIYWKTKGVKIIFEFIKIMNDESFCRRFAMATASVKIIKILNRPLSFQMLQSHRVLRKTVAVRRRFQARWFDVEAEVLESLQLLAQGLEEGEDDFEQ